MANSKPSSKLQKLEEQMTCPVCLGIYNDPKTLPCHHSYCKVCLKGISEAQEGGDKVITCPQCRARTPIPQVVGVGGFVKSHHIGCLKELHSYLIRSSESQQITCDLCGTATSQISHRCKDCDQFLCQTCSDSHQNDTNHHLTNMSDIRNFDAYLFPTQDNGDLCTTHIGQPLTMFCDDCTEIVCIECVNESHKEHKCELVSDSYHKHCQMLEAALSPVAAGIKQAESVLSGEKEREIREQAEVMKREIQAMAEEMITLIQQKYENLRKNVDTVIDRKLQVVSEQKKAAETTLSQLQNCEDFVEQTFQGNSSDQVMQEIVDCMNRMSEGIDVSKFEPTEEANVQLVRDGQTMESLHHIGDVVFYSPSLIKECVVEINSRHLNRRDGSISFPFSIEFSLSSFVSVPILLLSCTIVPSSLLEEDITCVVTSTTHPGIYRVNASPVVRGLCTLTVKAGSVVLPSVPLIVPFNPFIDTAIPLHIIDGFNQPNGIVVTDDGHILVTENSGSCVTILDRDRNKINTFSYEACGTRFIHPRGLALTNDNCFLVLDDHRVRKMTMDGNCLMSVGNHGDSRHMDFQYPGGITVSPNTGNVWITDYCNDRVQVLTPDLTFSFTFGQHGTDEGQFDGPTSVVINKYGIAYVVDCNNHRIQAFTENGRFVSQFGTEGNLNGQLYFPIRIILDSHDNHLYITEEGNHRVSIFTTEGVFVTSFGEYGIEPNQFHKPYGITFDKEGYLYICDSYNRRIVIY